MRKVMTKTRLRYIFLLAFIGAIGICVTPLLVLGNPTKPITITLTPEMQKKSYVVGEPIRVRIDVRFSAQTGTMAFAYDAPWVLTKMRISSDSFTVSQAIYNTLDGAENLHYFDYPDRILYWQDEERRAPLSLDTH
jgi:uncharacterized protein (DUF58 family)